jgi:hypothetical protein
MKHLKSINESLNTTTLTKDEVIEILKKKKIKLIRENEKN